MSDTDGTIHCVEALHGRFHVLRHDLYVSRSMALYGEWTEGEFAFVEPLLARGDHCIDVGANLGCMTVPLAKAVGPGGSVTAFEPQPGLFRLLAANTVNNGVHNVRLHQAACGAAPGIVQVPELDYAHAYNYGALSLQALAGAAQAGGITRAVPVVRLDEMFDAPSLRLIKIDVEGMEAEVVRGAAGIIGLHRPFLYVENEFPGAASAASISSIAALGYRLFWHVAPLFNPANFRRRAENVFEGIACVNMFCAPVEARIETGALHEVASAVDHPRGPGE